jgi:hypothetical protein
MISIKEMMIKTTITGISDKLVDAYVDEILLHIKWNVHNGKIKIIYFVVKFLVLNWPSISRCMSRYKAYLPVSVLSFISCSMG